MAEKLENVTVDIGGEKIEFYYTEEHACYYQVGTKGEVGSFFIPVYADNTIDFENVGEVEVTHEEA
jgi:hypothetical protein